MCVCVCVHVCVSVMVCCPPPAKLKDFISAQQTYTSKMNTNNLTSKRILQFCCKVTDSRDASNWVRSPTVTVKVETGMVVWGVGLVCECVGCSMDHTATQ